mgnify:FL=1
MAWLSRDSGVERWLEAVLSVGFLLVLSMAVPVAYAQQQIFPAINLDCVEADIEFDFTTITDDVLVHCTVENPTAYSEEVSFEYDVGPMAVSGPSSMTVEADSEESFEVELRVDKTVEVGAYEVTISAQVTGAGGIPVSFITEPENYTLDAVVPEFIACNVNYGQESVTVEAGEEVFVSASYSCESNKNQSLKVEIHLVIDGSSQEDMWPSGFNVVDGACAVIISGGDGMDNCQFRVSTPSNLDEDWSGCLIILDERSLNAQSCEEEDSISLTVNAKESVAASIGFGQNGTLFEDLGISEDEEPYVIGGSAALLILIVVVVVVIRRRS